jgi:hypothetical protein
VNTLLTSDPLGLVISILTGINSSGQIVGYGYDSAGHTDAVLLTPVSTTPLPAALPMFLSGLGVISLFGCCRKRRVKAALIA